MNNKRINIDIFELSRGICTICITNIGMLPDKIQKCIYITKHFTKGNEFFFGHYRTDGINLTNKERAEYGKEISEYFVKNGKYEPIPIYVEKRKRLKRLEDYITVGFLPVSDGMYELLPKLFRYYLETIYFCPKVEWGVFVESFRNYIQHGTKDYVVNGFTDFLFTYGDSGDFSISFNRDIVNKDIVYQDIKKILIAEQ